MSEYVLSSLIAFTLFGMGLYSVSMGISNFNENRKSKAGVQMMYLLICTFLWNFGYAWMSLCYDTDFAYVPRALALFGVTCYMFFLIKYITVLVNYKAKWLLVFDILFWICSTIAFSQIITPSAVTFQRTAWGYWYISKMSWGRILQFATVNVTVIAFYFILVTGLKKTKYMREKYILKGYLWFGPILYIGYIVDTLVPSIFSVPAIPGSSIASFFSTMLLFKLSKTNRGFGISESNVSDFVFRDVKIPVIITDDKKRVALYNSYAKEFFAKTSEELDGSNIEEIVYGDSSNENIIFKYEKNDGSVLEYKLSNTTVYDKFEEPMYTIHFIQDVTTEQNHLREIEESRTVAENANMAKSNFLANMSHEIRTPMNAILGMSEIIMQNHPDNEVYKDVSEISVAAKNLLGIINDILDISKIEAGKTEIIPENYDMSSLLNDACSIIRIRVQESNTKLVIDVDSSLPNNIYGDQVRVRQLLLNIMGNAVKFTKQGTITLKAYWNNDYDNAEFYFDITDTGIGIKEEDYDKIFGEFSQVDTRKNRSVQGTGLGLAISKKLAMLMGGDITVTSTYGEGSTFKITIKQVIRDKEVIGDDNAKRIANATFSNNNRDEEKEDIIKTGAKVLVVDDVEMNLIIAQGMLKKYDIDADIASSGAEAIKMATEKDYDLIFMDHMMPEMDGIDTTRAIRNIPKENCKNVTIIALTANVLNDAKELFFNEGMQDFLAKPIEPKCLDEIVVKWL